MSGEKKRGDCLEEVHLFQDLLAGNYQKIYYSVPFLWTFWLEQSRGLLQQVFQNLDQIKLGLITSIKTNKPNAEQPPSYCLFSHGAFLLTNIISLELAKQSTSNDQNYSVIYKAKYLQITQAPYIQNHSMQPALHFPFVLPALVWFPLSVSKAWHLSTKTHFWNARNYYATRQICWELQLREMVYFLRICFKLSHFSRDTMRFCCAEGTRPTGGAAKQTDSKLHLLFFCFCFVFSGFDL